VWKEELLQVSTIKVEKYKLQQLLSFLILSILLSFWASAILQLARDEDDSDAIYILSF
jgi:hypothetical protein